MGSCLPAESAVAWLGLSLAKLGAVVGCVDPTAVPVNAALREIATPAAPVSFHNRAVCMAGLPLSASAGTCPLLKADLTNNPRCAIYKQENVRTCLCSLRDGRSRHAQR